MAINGTFNFANGSDVSLIFSWTATQSAVSNTSTISWKITTESGYNTNTQIAAADFTINGSYIWRIDVNSPMFNLTTGTVVASGTYTVTHDSVGDAQFTVAGNAVFGATPVDFDIYQWFSDSETFELDQISRDVKIVSASNFDDEQNPTITYSNPAGNVTTSLSIQLLSEDGTKTFAVRNISKTDTSCTITLSESERNILRAATPNSKTMNVKFKLVGVVAGKTSTDEVIKICTIVNAHPSVSAVVEDTNPTTIALTGDKGTLVRYYSNAKYTITATTYKNATVKSYSAENGASKLETATGTLNAVESSLFKFSVVDSRSNLTVANREFPMVSYVKLTCNFTYTNPTTSGDMTFTISGNYFNNTFGAVNNVLTLQYRSKADGDDYGEWITLTPTLKDNTYSIEISLSGLDYQTGYTFQARASDKLNPDYVYSEETYTKSLPIFHWSKDDVVFEVPVIFNAGTTGATGEGGGTSGTIEGDCNITGNLRLKGSSNYGNSLYFGDGSYCYLKETTDDDLTIHSSDLVIDVSKFVIDDASTVDINATTIKFNGQTLPTSGTWTPTLDSDVISAYYEQQGWYTKIGKVVTIGFYVQAECNSGHGGTSIRLTGIPYTPAYYAASGGECHFSDEVFTIASNFGFWEATTSSTVIAKKSNNELFKYNSDGGLITCSGTIIYTTA